MRRSLRACVLVVALALVASACGGGDDDDGSAAGTSSETTEADERPTETTEEPDDEGPDLDPASLDVCTLVTPADFKAVTGLEVPDATVREEMGARSCQYVAGGKGGSVGVNLGTPAGDEWKVTPQPSCKTEDLELDGADSFLVTCDSFARIGIRVRNVIVFVAMIRGFTGDADYLDEETAASHVRELGELALERARAA